MNMELANLRSTPNAKLPEVYRWAKAALANCDRIDECKDWADKAMALESYARQAHDQSLFNMAARIQLRAVNRCGELLKESSTGRGGDHTSGQFKQRVAAGTLVSQGRAAKAAGLSEEPIARELGLLD